MMEPIPLGTVVSYNDCPGERYVVTAHANPEILFSGRISDEILGEIYIDNVAYEIWKEGVLRKFGNSMHMYWRVRRSSLTVIGDDDASPADPS
jgi:hypothetical protein